MCHIRSTVVPRNPRKPGRHNTVERDSVPFFFTLVTSPRGSLSLELSDTRVYEPQTRARWGPSQGLPRGKPMCSDSEAGSYLRPIDLRGGLDDKGCTRLYRPVHQATQGYLAHKKHPPPKLHRVTSLIRNTPLLGLDDKGGVPLALRLRSLFEPVRL